MAKKTTVKAAPKKAAPTKAAPRKKAAAKTPGENNAEKRKEVESFKTSVKGKNAIQEMYNNRSAMIEKNVFHRESNKTK